MGFRQRVADVLHKVGVLDVTLRSRRALKVPVLSIISYHHLHDPSPDYPFDPAVADATPSQFRRQLELLARNCNVVGLADVLAALDGETLPTNPVMIAFDDGYKSNLQIAAPILGDLGMKATFFIATDYVDQRRLYWWEAVAYLIKHSRHREFTLEYPRREVISTDNPRTRWRINQIIKNHHGLQIDRFIVELAAACGLEWTEDLERELCDRLIMTWDEVRSLASLGMDIGSHTSSHRVLQTVPDAELHAELAGSKELLERELNQPIRAIAYPVGRPIIAEHRLAEAVRAAGYDVGFTNASGVNVMSTRVGARGAHRYDMNRLATDSEMSDGMYLAQVAVPLLAYRAPPPAAH